MPTRLRICLNLTVCAGLICAGLAAYISHSRPALPDFDAVRASHAQGSHDVVLDRRDLVIERWRRAGQAVWQAPWQSLENFQPILRETVIASEDQRFYAHAGVDIRALLAGALASLGQRRGGSTLSMQTARLLLGREALPPTLWGKLRQIDAALALERRWSKAQILEAYLNLAPLRGGVRGFQTGQVMWLNALSASEQERVWPLLVAMLPAPQASPATLRRRSCAAARRLSLRAPSHHTDCQSHSAADWALWEAVWMQIFKPNTPLAGVEYAQSAIDLAAKNTPSTAKRSTVDGKMQAVLAQHLIEALERMRDSDVNAAAAVLIDNASGEVLAYGSAAIATTAANANSAIAPPPAQRQSGLGAIQARRTLASTLKPFLYAQALDARLLDKRERIQLRGREFRQGACDLRPYRPRDSVALYQSQVSPALGLAASSNVAAVDIISRLGAARFESSLHTLQILKAQPIASATCQPLPRYGHALALGAASGSLLDLTNAYRSLANGGVYAPAKLWMDSSDPMQAPQRIFSASSAAWVSATLSDQRLRFEGFGPRNPLDTLYWSASKTGTSDGSKDNWAMGYTRTQTLGVWIGNTQGYPMLGVFGPAGAAQIWRAVMDSAEQMREFNDQVVLTKSSNAMK